MRRALVLVCFAFALAGCVRHRVATQPDLPPLAPPPPPPRVVTPPEIEQQPVPPVPEPERKAPRRVPPRNEARPEPPKPQPPAKPDTATPPPKEEPQPPPTTLQTTPPGAQQDMERQARGLLTQARRDLGRINQRSLNADGKGQYETASRFVEQADQALKAQNFVLALSLADKAATIAAVLVGR